MKCKYCNGTGEHVNDANRMTTCEFCGGTGEVEVVGDSVTDVCDKCGGTGFFCEMRMGDGCTLGSPCPHQKPLTNEEYIRSCSTEELVEELSALIGWSITDYWMQKYEVETREDAVRMWLKEKKHDD